MTQQQFTIDSLEKIINIPFACKQLKIENNSPFYLYINLSTNKPTNSSSDYTIQPNAVIVTPAVMTNAIYVVAGGLNLSKGIAKVTAYDSATQQAATLPTQTSQFIGNFPNYPYTLPAGSSSGQHGLPSVQIDKFQTVYFVVSPSRSVVGIDAPLAVTVQNSVQDNALLGSIGSGGGVLPYSPTVIPNLLLPSIYNQDDFPTLTDRLINIIQTSDPIDTGYYNISQSFSVTGLSSITYSFPANPPYVLISFEIPFATPFITPINITIDISFKALSKTSTEAIPLYNSAFVGAVVAQQFLIRPKVLLIPEVGALNVKVTNLAAVTYQPLLFRVYT